MEYLHHPKKPLACCSTTDARPLLLLAPCLQVDDQESSDVDILYGGPRQGLGLQG